MWLGDDFHHNGCCYLAHTFGFLVGDGHGKAINHSRNRELLLQRTSPRAGVGTDDGPPGGPNRYAEFDFGTDDGYEYFLQVGPLRNLAARMEESGKKNLIGIPICFNFRSRGDGILTLVSK